MASEVVFKFLLLLGLSLILLLTILGRSEAQVYKWVDERGVTNYGDRRPGAKLVVNDRVSVVDLQADNAAAAEAVRIRNSVRLGPYPYGAIFVLGERPYVRPVEEPRLFTHSIGKAFNAYGRNPPGSSSGARIPLFGQAVRMGNTVQVFGDTLRRP